MLLLKKIYKKIRPQNTKDLEEKSLKKDTSGATAIEYGMIAALLSLAILASVKTMGTSLTKTFSDLSSKVVSVNATG